MKKKLDLKVSKEILSLVAYKPGKPISEAQREYGLAKFVKLASNENPLGPSPKVVQAIQDHLKEIHLYPDPTSYDLIQVISKKWKLPAEQIAIGNGSNELIDLVIRILCEPGEAILTSEAAFVAYNVCAQGARVNRYAVPLAPGFRTNIPAMIEFLETNPKASEVRVIFVPNPNNPTGTYVTKMEVEDLLKAAAKKPHVMVVFDEAYNEFVRAADYESAQQQMEKYPNVAVIRTLSKAYGLAGLRVGVLLANEALVDLVNRVRNPFNVNNLAQSAAIAGLQDDEFVSRTQQVTWKGLDQIYQGLKKLQLPYVESQGNFVLFDTLRDVAEAHQALLKRGVILRPVGNYGFRTHMRMSVGLPEENEIALRALGEVLQILKPI